MPKFPAPPPIATLGAIPPQLHVLKRGETLWRIYSRGGRYPVRWDEFRPFGPTSNRFDHHLPPPRVQARAILYAASDPLTCFAEVFQATRTIDRRRDRPTLVGFKIQRDMSLLDLTGTWPTQAGASMAINSGPRPRARAWSAAIYAAYPSIDGLLYPSSMNANKPSVALYERARSAVGGRPALNRLLSDKALNPVVVSAGAGLNYRVVP